MPKHKGITAGLLIAAISAAGAAGAAAHSHKTKSQDDLDAADNQVPVTDISPVAATSGTNLQAQARAVLAAEGYGAAEFDALSRIVDHESGWNPKATNASSGAYGLFQALPGSKMASAGSDWRTNPATQMKWGIKYMKERYGSPSGAWAFWQKHRWY